MPCRFEMVFIKTITKSGNPSFDKLIKTVDSYQRRRIRFRWKPDQVMIKGTTVGYMLYIYHDC